MEPQINIFVDDQGRARRTVTTIRKVKRLRRKKGPVRRSLPNESDVPLTRETRAIFDPQLQEGEKPDETGVEPEESEVEVEIIETDSVPAETEVTEPLVEFPDTETVTDDDKVAIRSLPCVRAL